MQSVGYPIIGQDLPQAGRKHCIHFFPPQITRLISNSSFSLYKSQKSPHSNRIDPKIMTVSALTPKPHYPQLIQTLNPKTSISCSLFSCSCSCSSTTETNAKKLTWDSNIVSKRSVFNVGVGLLAASIVTLSPLEADATRIEYWATVGDPLCEMNFARSGLGFCDLSVGSGVKAPRGELINIHYTARFGDGTVFDSSYKRGRPLTMRIGVGKVIKGLDQGIYGGEGVPPMQVGGKRKLKIPSNLAYGPEPAGCFGGDCNIPGNATLLYDIDFVGIYSGNRELPKNR